MPHSLLPKKKTSGFIQKNDTCIQGFERGGGVSITFFQTCPEVGRRISPRWGHLGNACENPDALNDFFWRINPHLSKKNDTLLKGFLGTHFKGYLPNFTDFYEKSLWLHILHTMGTQTFISRGYDPYIDGFTTFIFHGLGVQGYGMVYILGFQDYVILIKNYTNWKWYGIYHICARNTSLWSIWYKILIYCTLVSDIHPVYSNECILHLLRHHTSLIY